MIPKAKVIGKTPPVKGQIIPNVRIRDVDTFVEFSATYASVNSEAALSITIGKLVFDANMLWIEVPGAAVSAINLLQTK